MGQVNKTLIREKLDTVIRCVSRIQQNLSKTPLEFQSDYNSQDIVSVNLERAVQACVDSAGHIISYQNLPSTGTMADAFKVLENSKIISLEVSKRMRNAVGLRNLLVHQYKKVDWNVVWSVATHRLEDLKLFCHELNNWLATKESEN